MKYIKKVKICLKETHPELANEWHPTKNGQLTPNDVTYGLAKKVWWQCCKGHEWLVSLNDRTSHRLSRCPYCAGRLACKENSLNTLNKQLANEWHPTKNGQLTTNDVTLHYGKKVWWQCNIGHEWQATVDKRSNKRSCPYCLNKKINESNSLEKSYPRLSSEWHPTKNALMPSQVAPNCGKKVWWICKKGHEWITRICQRHRSGCPFCKAYKTQKELFYIVKNMFPSEKVEFNYTNDELRFPDTNCKIQLDIYIPSKNLAIEYQGRQHFYPIEFFGGFEKYKYTVDRDNKKRIICQSKNIKLFEVNYTWKKDKETITKLLEEYV